MQAVNAIGHGAFCLPLKVVTKSLPPQPPCLECVVVGSSSLKLKWRDSRYIDLTQYILEMQRSDGRSVWCLCICLPQFNIVVCSVLHRDLFICMSPYSAVMILIRGKIVRTVLCCFFVSK